MAKKAIAVNQKTKPLSKLPTGIQGFDEITGGGLPEGRIALVSGGPGCGKTLFGAEFLVRGAMEHGEPGLFVAFEETADELEKNVAGLGFDLKSLEAKKKFAIDHVYIERSEIEETGDYDLEGLFIRLNHAIDGIKAKRVVLDTLEALFSGFPNELILRAELRRLFRWLKDKGVTTIVTAEKGDGTLTRHGLEEYVSDCVILLQHSVIGGTATRRLRVVKYRGSHHGTNEYPFLIGNDGISVLPITSLELSYGVSTERLGTGIPRLDAMLGGQGVYKGSSVLVSGTAGTGKSSMAATITNHICSTGRPVLYLAFEESREQIVRNMRSIGVDLEQWIKKGLLHFHTVRPTVYGLEMHLVTIHDLVNSLKPGLVVFDPISNLVTVGGTHEVKSMLTRLIDYLKLQEITTVFTNLLSSPEQLEQTDVGVSSLMDVWIVLRDVESNGERNRIIHILKARGTKHSNQLREFLITSEGLQIVDVYLGQGRVLTGSARAVQEAADRADETRRRYEAEHRVRESERKQILLEAQIAALKAELEGEKEAAQVNRKLEATEEFALDADRERITALRQADQKDPMRSGDNRRKNARK